MNYAALTEFYFTDLVLLTCNFIAAVAAFKSRKNQELNIIRIYIFLSLGFNLICYVGSIVMAPTTFWEKSINKAMNIYTLIECTLLFIFIRRKTFSKPLKLILLLIYSVFICFWIFILFWYPKAFADNVSVMAGIQAFTLLLLCLICLQSNIKQGNVTVFLKSPDFYILLGTLCFLSFSGPLYLSVSFVGLVDYNLESMFYCLVLLGNSTYFLIIRKGFYALSKN